MVKKNYVKPATMVVSVATHGHILDGSVQSIGGNTTMKFGGASSNAGAGGATARTKDAGEVYDVWDDDWSE